MKRIYLLFFLIMLLGLTSCGTNSNEVNEIPKENNQEIEENITSELESKDTNVIEDIIEEIVEEKKLCIQYPGSAFDSTEEEYLNDWCENIGFESVEYDDDNDVVSVYMTETEYDNFKAALRENYIGVIDELTGSESFATISKVEYNDDFTKFKVYVTSTQLSLVEQITALFFYKCGHLYCGFIGTPVDNVEVTYINIDSNEVLGVGNSKEYYEQNPQEQADTNIDMNEIMGSDFSR